MQIVAATRLLLLLWLVALMGSGTAFANSENQLRELLATETALIDALRDYSDALEQQLESIKRETGTIQQLHDQVGEHISEHLGNPLNVLTILKRFQSAWPWLEEQATATHNLATNVPDFELKLHLPSEEDYETALLNLLRLQSVYDLEPATLALGVVNGLKLGSSMSWSDCLDMARTSDRTGDYIVAKYWLETALGQLSAANNASSPLSGDQERGRVQILEAALSMDYRAGEFASALATAKELLLLRPASQNLLKAKTRIERAINKTKAKLHQSRKPRAKLEQNVEQMLTNELCRMAATQRVAATGSRYTECRMEMANLRMLRLEQLSKDPHIMLYHDAASGQQVEQLISWLHDELEMEASEPAAFAPLKFTQLAQRQLQRIVRQVTPQQSDLWQARLHSHEHVTAPKEPTHNSGGHVARAMLNLQESKLGGALTFPQLELSVNVPRGALLYWRTRSIDDPSAPFSSDYRSQQLVCPVLLGKQLTAWAQLS